MKNKDRVLNLIVPIISILCILILWSAVAVVADNPYLLPTFGQTVTVFFSLFGKAEFYLALFGTVIRSLIAFIISFALALGLAILTGKYKRVQKAVAPIISIIRVLPTIAVVLLLLVWTNDFVAPIIVTFLVVFPTLYLNVKNALDSVDYEQIQMCNVFGVSKKDILLKVQLPQIYPPIFKAIGAGLSLNIKLMVAAEVLAFTTNSLGNLLHLSKLYDQMATMMALVLVTVILGLIIEGVFSLISKKMGKWQ